MRFPPILSLIHEPPVDFQLRFAEAYPVAELSVTRPILIVQGAAPGVQPPAPDKPMESTTNFRFCTRDKAWSISIEAGLLALSCARYREWKEFRERFAEVLTGFLEMYKVPLATRVGLRYRDVINRQELGLQDVSWNRLLRPEVLSTFLFFADELDETHPANMVMELDIPPGRVRIGISTAKSSTKGAGLMIDTDCFLDGQMDASTDGLMKKADEFHDYSHVVFQACISDTLHGSLAVPNNRENMNG